MAELFAKVTPRRVEPRAPRLSLRAPITLGTAEGGAQSTGWTVNISRSGVLFQIDHPAELPRELAYVIQLSKGALQGPGVAMLPNLHCSGRVVRQGHGVDGTQLYAVTIQNQQIDDAP